MFKLFVIFVSVFVVRPAFAETTDLKTVSSILLYETACDRSADSQMVLNHLLNKRAAETNTTPSDVFAQAKVLADMINGLQGDAGKREAFCGQMRPVVAEAAAEQKASVSDRHISGRMKNLVEFLLLFSLGATVAFFVGKIYRWKTGVNINASRFWIVGWGFGFIALSRVIVEIMKRAP